MDLSGTRIQQLTDSATIAGYTGDESSSFHGSATAVVLPRTVDEVCEVVVRAIAQHVPLTLSGAGTSITGSRVPHDGVVLSTERLRDLRLPEWTRGWDELSDGGCRVLLSPGRARARVPAGVRLSELDRLLAAEGRLYPPDPTEMTAMLGGTIATNASGSRSYRYGATRNWVEALLVVTACGEACWIRRGAYVASEGELRLPDAFPASALTIPPLLMPQTKHAAGLYLTPDVDLVDLLVGSEGTLAVVVAAELGLVERPEPLLTLAAFLEAPEAAFSLVEDVRDYASVLSVEYFDGRALAFIRSQYPQTPEAGACVLFEMEFAAAARHNPYPGPAMLERWDSLLAGHDVLANWVATGEELRGMKAFRHALPEQVNRWVAAREGKLGTDMAVPAAAFSAMHDAYRRAQEEGIRTVLFGHLGEYHLHLNFLPEDSAEMERAREIYRGLARRAVELGGTVSAEHGVGKKALRDEEGRDRPYLFYLYGEAGLAALAGVKAVLDPHDLLNPGTMVPEA